VGRLKQLTIFSFIVLWLIFVGVFVEIFWGGHSLQHVVMISITFVERAQTDKLRTFFTYLDALPGVCGLPVMSLFPELSGFVP
jgi:hypothetical protein